MTANTDDFFHSRLNHMIDMGHPLAVLASRMAWQEIEASLAHRFARQVKVSKKIDALTSLAPPFPSAVPASPTPVVPVCRFA